MSRSYSFDARLRSTSERRIFLSRIDLGVISTYSSSRIYSNASSSENITGGAIEVFSSEPEARIFVSCLALVTFTVMSF